MERLPLAVHRAEVAGHVHAQIAIKALQSNISVDLGLAMAGSFLVTVPLLVLFAFFGKQMVSGIMDGAFKG